MFSKTKVFGELETAVLVLGLRPRPRSEPKTLDRLTNTQRNVQGNQGNKFDKTLFVVPANFILKNLNNMTLYLELLRSEG